MTITSSAPTSTRRSGPVRHRCRLGAHRLRRCPSTSTAPSARTPLVVASPTCWRSRPVTRSRRRSSGARARGRAVADPAASHRLGAAPAVRTGCARGSGSRRRLAGGRAARHGATTTRGIRTAWCGRCSRSSTPRWASRGAGRWPRTSATEHTGDRAASCGGPAVRRGPAARGPVRGYASQRPAMLADWRRGAIRRRRSPARRRPGVAARAVAPAARSGSTRRRRTSGSPTARAAARRPRLVRPARRGSRSSAPPGCRPPSRAAGRAGRAPGRPPVAAAPVARAVGRAAAAGRGTGRSPRADDPRAERAANPLLSSLGRDVPRAAAHAGRRAGRRRRAPRRRPTTRPTPLLGWLQRRPARRPAARPPTAATLAARRPQRSRCTPATARPGRSRCCARSLLGLLARRPDPGAARHPGDVPRHRGVRAADPRRRSGWPTPAQRRRPPGAPAAGAARRPRAAQTNPLLGTVARLLELADAPAHRLPGARPRRARRPVRRRFGFDDDDLDRLARLGRRAPACAGGSTPRTARRSGWTASRRTPGRAGSTGCCSASRWPSERRPLARHRRCRSTTSDSGDIDLVGRLAEFVDRLRRRARRAVRRAAGRRVDRDADRDGVLEPDAVPHRDALAGRRSSRASSRRRRRRRPRGRRRHAAAARRRARPARRPARAAARPGPTSAPARSPSARWCRCARCRTGWSACSGWTTACSPARRRSTATTCWPATRWSASATPAARTASCCSTRSCAATEHLVITYTGADERTGVRRPPAVPLGELLDALDATRRPDAGADAGRRRATRCSRSTPQLHCPARSAGPGRSASTAPRSPARGPRRGRRHRRRRVPAAPLAAGGRADEVELDDLVALPGAPGQGVPAPAARRRRCAGRGRARADALPSSWTAWQKWAVGDRLLRDRLAGPTRGRAVQAEWRRGELPPGALGRRAARRGRATGRAAGRGRPRELRAGPAARRVTSTSTCAGRPPARRHGRRRARHERLVARRRTPRSRAKHRLAAWVELLALTAAHPDDPWRGRTPSASGSPAARHAPRPGRVGQAAARGAAAPTWSRCTTRGLREPLPLPLKTSLAYADDQRRRARDVDRDATAPRGVERPATSAAPTIPGEARRRRTHVVALGPSGAAARGAARPPATQTHPVRRRSRCGCGPRCSTRPRERRSRCDGDVRPRAARCPPAPPCWRPAPAPARRSRSRALVTRYVAEGVGRRSTSCCLVTFGRAATQELRERVRERLVEAERGARRPGRRARGHDTADPAARRRRRRERRGRTARPAARRRWPTSTRHHRHHPPVLPAVLAGLGVAGDADPDAVLVETWTTWWSRSSTTSTCASTGHAAGTPRSTAAEALDAGPRARSTTRRPGWSPPSADPGTDGRSRRRRVRHAPCAPRSTGASARRRCSATTTCSPGCADALRRDDAAARDRLRARYQVVLVDEFQDTDPVQWEILRRAFHGARHAGADRRPQAGDLRLPRRRRRHATCGRRHRAAPRPTLATNWRSDAPLLDALEVTCSAAPRSATRGSSCTRSTPRTPGAAWRRAVGAPVRLRVRRPATGCAPAPRSCSRRRTARERVAGDLAADIGALLAAGATVDGRAARGRATSRCWCAPTTRRAGAAGAGRGRGARVLPAAASVFGTPAGDVADAAGGARAAAAHAPGCAPRR